MPRSRNFGGLWGVGLSLAVPVWAFALVAPSAGAAVLLIDAAHHVAIVLACGAAWHFGSMIARRQDEAWARVKPSVITVPVRLAGPRKAAEAPAPAAAAPAPAAARIAAPKLAAAPPPPPSTP